MAILSRLRQHVRDYRCGLWELTGAERDSGEHLRILYAGNARNKNYLANTAFTGAVAEVDFGRKWLWDIRRLSRRPDPRPHLLITEIRKGLRRRAGLRGFYVPVWVDGVMPFDDMASQMKTSEHVKSDLRRIRKNALAYEVTRDEAAMVDFYHRMYLPHTTRAHGNEAVPHALETVLKNAPRSDLLLIIRDGQVIAGEMIVYEPEGPHFWCSGVVDGNQDYVKAGALAALYYYRYVYLSEQGYDRVHVGASRGFMRDGVFQYKKKWGMRVITDRDTGLVIDASHGGVGERNFLKNSPFIYDDGAALRAAMFVDTVSSADAEQLRDIYRRHHVAGTAGLDIYCFDGMPSGIDVPHELAGRLTIRSADL